MSRSRFLRRALGAALAATTVVAVAPTSARGSGPVPASAQPARSSQAGAPVPPGFRAQSLTWVSPERGWVLGVGPCATGTCTIVAATGDGGASWSVAGTMAAPVSTTGGPGVTEIDFADTGYGWASGGPYLQRTTDGGRTWTPAPLPGGGRQVLSLLAEASQVYAVVSSCPPDQFSCPTPPTLWRAPVASSSWQRVVDVNLPLGSTSPVLAASGRTTYVLGRQFSSDPDALFYSPDGLSWSSRPSPCDKGQGEMLADVAPTSLRDVALLCLGSPGFSKATKRVFRSTDSALTTTSAGSASVWGIVTELAATPGGTLALSTYSSGSSIYLNADCGPCWTAPVDWSDGGEGWNDLAFTDESTGWIVYSPVSGYPGRGTLMSSRDGGHTWATVPLAP